MNDGLFDLNVDPEPEGVMPPAARDEQVSEIRARFDASPEFAAQDSRQRFVEETVLHAVASLRSLTALEALRVLERLKSAAPERSITGRSTWDDRDHDTWIDKM